MTKDDPWAYWDAGVEVIRRKLGCSEGKAQKIMDDAAKSGEVRVREGYGIEALIGPVRSKPGGHTFLRGKGSAETKTYEAFNIADFKYWFNEHYPAAAKAKQTERKGGRLPKVEWSQLQLAFRSEVEKRGWPDATNTDDWNCQARVEDWIKKVHREKISDSTARKYAKDLLSKKIAEA